MKPFKLAVLLALGIACAITVADGQETRITLEAAREQGRSKSRYVKEIKATADTSDAIPKAIPFHASRMNTIGGAKSPGFQGVGLSLTGLTFPEVQPPRMPPHSKLLQDQHL